MKRKMLTLSLVLALIVSVVAICLAIKTGLAQDGRGGPRKPRPVVYAHECFYISALEDCHWANFPREKRPCPSICVGASILWQGRCAQGLTWDETCRAWGRVTSRCRLFLITRCVQYLPHERPITNCGEVWTVQCVYGSSCWPTICYGFYVPVGRAEPPRECSDIRDECIE